VFCFESVIAFFDIFDRLVVAIELVVVVGVGFAFVIAFRNRLCGGELISGAGWAICCEAQYTLESIFTSGRNRLIDGCDDTCDNFATSIDFNFVSDCAGLVENVGVRVLRAGKADVDEGM